MIVEVLARNKITGRPCGWGVRYDPYSANFWLLAIDGGEEAQLITAQRAENCRRVSREILPLTVLALTPMLFIPDRRPH
jgi:hypothetical protein